MKDREKGRRSTLNEICTDDRLASTIIKGQNLDKGGVQRVRKDSAKHRRIP